MLLTFLLKTFKNSFYLFGTYFVKNIYRFGLFSKGFYCLLFNVLFPFLCVERFALYYTFLRLSTLFRHFFKKLFLLFLRQNKKLVIDVLFYSFSCFFLLILTFSFLFFVCCLVLIYINILFCKSQYVFWIFLFFFEFFYNAFFCIA